LNAKETVPLQIISAYIVDNKGKNVHVLKIKELASFHELHISYKGLHVRTYKDVG
jgi:hypothetical protein